VSNGVCFLFDASINTSSTPSNQISGSGLE